MKDIKLLLCNLGLPLELINEEENIHLVIELNKNYDIVTKYYKIGEKEWNNGYIVYLSDVDNNLLKKCYPSDLTKRLQFLYQIN